jgi:hypothetical protein
MLDRAISNLPHLNEFQQQEKDNVGWRYTFTGLEKELKKIDPQHLINERRRPPTKEEVEQALLKRMEQENEEDNEEDMRNMKA